MGYEYYDNVGDDRWILWKDIYIENNKTGRCKTFVVLYDGMPIGEGTLLFSAECVAINGRTNWADGTNIVNVNALRMEKAYEGQGHILKLVRFMEQYAADKGYKNITIGVEAREPRNLAIFAILPAPLFYFTTPLLTLKLVLFLGGRAF